MTEFFTYRVAYGLLSLGLFSLSACQKESEQLATAPADSNLVSLHEAELAAQHSSNSFLVQQLIKQSPSGVAKQDILNVLAIPTRTQPAFYIANYRGGGYIILAADRRVEPILAYSETGSYQKEGKLPYGLTSWLTRNYDNMQQLRQHNELSAPSVATAQWTELLAAPVTKGKDKPTGTATNKEAPEPTPCQGYSETRTAGPLLVTAWGQGCDYNDYCPTGTYMCAHVPTGCVATAMSQIMYYWKFPNSIPWSAMETGRGNLAVASLMQQTGAAVGMQYSDQGSSANTYSIGDALRDTYHYTSVTYGDYNYSTVMANLNAGQPIVLQGFTDHAYSGWFGWGSEYGTGEAHAWVCDGYQNTYYNDCTTSGQSSLLHMNWGWNEAYIPSNYNGWYRESDWTVARTDKTLNFQYIKKMLYNIHP